MSMRQCPVCNERYSDTYKHCPFCEEEAALRKGKKIRRRGGRRVAKGGFDPSGIVITLVILLVVGLGAYFFLGDTIADIFGIRDNPDTEQTGQQSGQQSGEIGGEENPPVGDDQPAGGNEGGEDVPPAGGEDGGEDTPPVNDQPAAPETAVALAKNDITLSATYGLSAKLQVSGGSGSYTWHTSNASIVSVTGDGKVTGITEGQATITVSDGYTKAECIVRVKMN